MQKTKRKIVYLDVETKIISDNVEGGWDNVQSFGVSIAVIYATHLGMFGVYHEESLKDMIENVLTDAEVIVGFNLKHFDYQVLLPYSSVCLYSLPTFDIFEQVKNQVGSNVSLNNISSNTLGIKKTGDPKDAPDLYWQGDITTLSNYCIQDVEMTRRVFNNGCVQKHIDYFDRNKRETVRLDTSHWVDTLSDIVASS